MQDTSNIAVIGHLSIDKIRVKDITYSNVLGGAALYSALSMNSVGNQVHIISTYCEDFDFESVKKTAGKNISLNQVLPVLGKQRQAFMEYTLNFERTSYNHARAEWLKDTKDQSPRHVPNKQIKYDAVMLVPMLPEVQRMYVEWFRRHTSALIALDTSEYFAQNNREELISLIQLIDIFIPSDVELNYLFPENNGDIENHIQTLIKLGLKKIVIKMSTKGSVIVEDSKITYCGIRETNAMDTTGAGDSFAGSLISYYVRNRDLVMAAKYAAVVSSICVEKVGYLGLVEINSDYAEKEALKIQIDRGIIE